MLDKSTLKEGNEQEIKWFSFKLTRPQAFYLYVGLIIGLLVSMGNFLDHTTISIWLLIDGAFPTSYIVFSLLSVTAAVFFWYSIFTIRPFLSQASSPEKSKETRWFGIIINRRRAPILFFLGLSAFFNYIIRIQILGSSAISIGFLSPETFDSIIRDFITSMNLFLFLGASIYTMITMRRIKSDEVKEMTWFNFELSHNMRSLISLTSLFGMLFFTFWSTLFFVWMTSINDLFPHTTNQAIGLLILVSLHYIGILAVAIVGFLISLYSFLRIRKIKKYDL